MTALEIALAILAVYLWLAGAARMTNEDWSYRAFEPLPFFGWLWWPVSTPAKIVERWCDDFLGPLD